MSLLCFNNYTQQFTVPMSIFSVLLLVLSGCSQSPSVANDPIGSDHLDTLSDEPQTDPGGDTGTDTGSGIGDTGSVSQGVNAPYDAEVVFDDSVLRTFELDLPPDRWQWLIDHALDKTYVDATLRVDGELVGTVGVRFKGHWTLESCFEEHPQVGCPKMSLKLKFNHVDPDLRWYGLKKLNFHAGKADPTLLHDRLAYQIFRQMDIVASNATHANVVVNGNLYGLFSLVEAVDGAFTDHSFEGHGDGDLYKEAWPTTTDISYYAEHISTNEETATHQRMLAFASELLAAD